LLTAGIFSLLKGIGGKEKQQIEKEKPAGERWLRERVELTKWDLTRITPQKRETREAVPRILVQRKKVQFIRWD